MDINSATNKDVGNIQTGSKPALNVGRKRRRRRRSSKVFTKKHILESERKKEFEKQKSKAVNESATEAMEVPSISEPRKEDTALHVENVNEDNVQVITHKENEIETVSISSGRKSSITRSQTGTIHTDKYVEEVDLAECSEVKEVSGRRCCNFECEVKESLQNAPVFVLTYFGLKYSKGKSQKVCQTCYSDAVGHQENLAVVLLEHKPLLNFQFPYRNDTVIIQDSDEELSEEEEPLPGDVITDIEEKLLEVIDSSLENYDLDYQLKESERILHETLTNLEAHYKETDALFSDLQKSIDTMRYEFYQGFSPKIKEMPSVTILDSDKAYKTLTTSPAAYISPSPVKRYSFPVDNTRRSPIAGVATKKVTQVQRTVFPGLPQIEMTSQTQQQQHQQQQQSLQMQTAQSLQSQQQEVVALEQVEQVKPVLPPLGNLSRPRPLIGDVMYVMKYGYYGMWSRAKILEAVPKELEVPGTGKTDYIYKVKFENRKSNAMKQVSGRQMAYPLPSPVRLPVGTRVIALFRDEWARECYYAGIIAEPPKSMNKYRYLVFFDDGYAQYVYHEKILLVCESSRNVWEDIHPDSREFVRNYLEQYPERPMVKLQRGQIVKTEWNGKWWIARVVEVDGSLVKMHFDADGRTELIYRGSTRLGPLFSELAQAAARKVSGSFTRHRGLGIASLKKRNMPYVEYTHTDIDENKHEDGAIALLGPGSRGFIEGHLERQFPSRAVAKKSTSRRPESILDKFENIMIATDRELRGGRVDIVLVVPLYKPRTFNPHQCGAVCIDGVKFDPTQAKIYNPLITPLIYGWQRHVTRCRGKRMIFYRGPCGRRLRNMEELHRYLRVTRCFMSVDQFDFDFWVHCFTEFVVNHGFLNIKDLSYGRESVPVPCVNSVDHSEPEYVKYSTVRLPMEGVNLNVNPEYLVGCDCTDDCQDKSKCACWQLTIQGTAYGPGGRVDPTVGYCFKRLLEPVMTGIYECNSRCKCAKTCLNRVAQHPLQLRLQVFKTENRGWGIRCLNDIPQGAFICIYAGRLLTEQGANEGGKNYGDEYLAELDYIEVVERLKEGYESDVVEDEDMAMNMAKDDHLADDMCQVDSFLSEEEEEEDGETSQDARDSDFELDNRHLNLTSLEECTIRTRLRNRKARTSLEESQGKGKEKVGESKEEGTGIEKDIKKIEIERKASSDDTSSLITLSDDEDDVQREPSRFSAVAGPKKEIENKPKNKSVREYFGEEEFCYIMDAKNDGNIGRYLNHSCSPNVFVQNVFVDTHDLRFPWVAFFALTYISAGTELTWDYNYDVGSVPGKVLHCYCGSSECRGRLL